MPRYFVDTSDQEFQTSDDVGHEFRDVEAASAAAVTALAEMWCEALPCEREFLAIVRGDDGRPLLRATLSLHLTSLA